ncbi:hypothetical protein C8R45DRAFT_1192558 [Mycena sanguinolenta]|nr:hypothetical protein C8R45DRAFT_1192558 [Mycena sanguinolenta]
MSSRALRSSRNELRRRCVWRGCMCGQRGCVLLVVLFSFASYRVKFAYTRRPVVHRSGVHISRIEYWSLHAMYIVSFPPISRAWNRRVKQTALKSDRKTTKNLETHTMDSFSNCGYKRIDWTQTERKRRKDGCVARIEKKPRMLFGATQRGISELASLHREEMEQRSGEDNNPSEIQDERRKRYKCAPRSNGLHSVCKTSSKRLGFSSGVVYHRPSFCWDYNLAVCSSRHFSGRREWNLQVAMLSDEMPGGTRDPDMTTRPSKPVQIKVDSR